MATMLEATRSHKLRLPGIISIAFLTVIVLVGIWIFLAKETPPTTQEALQRVESLVRQGDDGIPVLVQLLSDRNPNIRAASLNGLARIGVARTDVIESVRRCLADDVTSVKACAVLVYWRVSQNPEVVVPAIVRMVDDPDQYVYESVIQTLNEIGEVDTPDLNRMLTSTSADIRIPTWKILRQSQKSRHTAKLRDRIQQLLDHPNPEVHQEALISFIYLGNHANVEQLRELFQITKDDFFVDFRRLPGPTIEEIAVEGVGILGPAGKELIPELVSVIERLPSLEKVVTVEDVPAVVGYELHPRFLQVLWNLTNFGDAARPSVPVLVHRLDELHASNRITIFGSLLDFGCDLEIVKSRLDSTISELENLENKGIRDTFMIRNDSVTLLFQRLITRGCEPEFVISRTRALLSQLAMNDPHFVAIHYDQLASFLVQVSPMEARRIVTMLLPKLTSANGEINIQILPVMSALAPVAQEAIPTILPLISRANRSNKWHLLRALSGIGPESVGSLQSLITILHDDSDTDDFNTPATVIGLIGQIGPEARPAVASLLEIIESPSSQRLRPDAIRSLGKIADNCPEVMNVLREQLISSFLIDRLLAAEALASVAASDESVLNDLIMLLSDEAERVRAQAAFCIGGLTVNRQPAVEALIHCLADESPYVRTAAILSLGKIGSDAKTALPHLKSMDLGKIQVDPNGYRTFGWGNSMGRAPLATVREFENRTAEELIRSAISAIEQ